ncbi:MAG: YlxR family protein [Anaerolineales bacterium]|nr:YlxR family protein [Anaerolineales bacterium]
MKKHRKHIPQRTCVGCRTVLAKRELIRVVRTAEGIHVDPTGKHAGRGAYLHNQRSCWEIGIKTGLERALKTTLTPDDKERLIQHMLTLPEDPSG